MKVQGKMPLDDNDRMWLEQLIDRKVQDVGARLLAGQRAQERRKLQSSGNLPAQIAALDLLIEELTERVRKLETQ